MNKQEAALLWNLFVVGLAAVAALLFDQWIVAIVFAMMLLREWPEDTDQ